MAKNKAEEEALDELEDTSAEPRVYELGFHLDPELPSEEAKKAFQEIHDRIAGAGSIVAEVEPHKIQLAYTISRQETSGRRDFDAAYFAWIVYEMTPEAHEEILSSLRGDLRLVRFIDLITTKEAARHAVEVHELTLKTERREDAEEGASAELDAALENVSV